MTGEAFSKLKNEASRLDYDSRQHAIGDGLFGTATRPGAAIRGIAGGGRGAATGALVGGGLGAVGGGAATTPGYYGYGYNLGYNGYGSNALSYYGSGLLGIRLGAGY